ncbi:hypothetical protein Drorol1_Dr00020731, partial [Drosera rotundifolia]
TQTTQLLSSFEAQLREIVSRGPQLLSSPQEVSSPCHNNSTCFMKLRSSKGIAARSSAWPANYSCVNTTVSNPYYQQNLFELLRELNSSVSRTRFYSTYVGEPPNRVYGQYFCRVGLEDCLYYISELIQQILNYCPYQIEVTIWFIRAMIRFSNYSFFGEYKIGAPNYLVCLYNNGAIIMNKTSESVSYKEFMIANLLSVTGEAYQDRRMFARKDVNYSSFFNSSLIATVTVIVECTPDLSSGNCKSCLNLWTVDLPTKCNGSIDGLVMYSSSCFIRYLTGMDLSDFIPPDPAPVATPAPVSLPHSLPPDQPVPSKTKQGKNTIIGVVMAAAASACVLTIATIILLKRRARKTYITLNPEIAKIELLTAESLQYDLIALEIATENFSDNNKIGRGGFGIVYKGVLENGQEIAVKRLTTNSEQSIEEFKNEIVLVAKLQHRNLVRLVGFCLAEEEKLLVFEFVPNKSLDNFLFDQDKKGQLDWRKRFKIIEGIARGLLYLHEDSRHKVIHRDLKPGNILLDADMIPKISDFGTARLVGMDESLNQTQRVAGTLGYMAPEYLLEGQFSVKSDVYSFGVLTLEIISGRKVRSFDQAGVAQSLLNDAWNHWNEGGELKFMDETLSTSQNSSNEVKKCVQLGLLCVQPDIDKRPTMATVVYTLNNLSISTLQEPQQPIHFSTMVAESSSSSVRKGIQSLSSLCTVPR